MILVRAPRRRRAGRRCADELTDLRKAVLAAGLVRRLERELVIGLGATGQAVEPRRQIFPAETGVDVRVAFVAEDRRARSKLPVEQ